MLTIALIPSNQDKNPTIGGDTEEAHVRPVAEELQRVLNLVPGVQAKLFIGTPESKDTYSFQFLREQQIKAREALALASENKLALNLHSDSGTYSHVGYYWRDAQSEELGKTCAALLSAFFGTDRILNGKYADYIFATYQRPETNALLLELGSHQNQSDYDKLKNNPTTAALLIREAICNFYNLTIPDKGEVIEDWTEGGIGFYAAWSNERRLAHEDPRDRAAFVLHLRKIGKDWTNPRKYGFPC